MNVTVNDIRSVKPGGIKSFMCDSTEAVRSVQSLVWYCNRVNRPRNVLKYKSSANYKDLIVTITAIAENVGQEGKENIL